MSYLFRCFLLSLFMAGTFHVSAQDYASKMKAIKAKTIEAANQRDFSLYLKLAYEEYNLTYQHRDTPAMVRACVNLVDYYISGELNSDSANLYIRRGRYLTSLKKDPEHELALKYMQANLYTKTGKYVQAYVLFKSMDSLVTKSNYDFAPYYNNAYADLLLYLKKDKEAIARTKMAAALFKKSKLLQDESMTYMNIAGLYFGGNEIDSVLLYLNKAIKINEALHDTFAIAECYTRLGLIYTRQGLRKEAIGYYKLAFDLTPRHPSSQLITNYANVLMSEGRFKEAEDMLAHLIVDEYVDNQLAGLESMITLREKAGTKRH